VLIAGFAGVAALVLSLLIGFGGGGRWSSRAHRGGWGGGGWGGGGGFGGGGWRGRLRRRWFGGGGGSFGGGGASGRW
jgi:uncharacterized protein